MNNNNGQRRPELPGSNPPSGMRQGFAGLAHDVLELGELQVRLAKLDAQENARKLRTTLIFTILGVAMLLACLPVALLALAEWLALEFQWTHASSLAAAAGCGLASAGMLLGLAVYKLRQGFATWERSSDEFQRNLTWLKQTLKPTPSSETVAGVATADFKGPPR